MLPPIFIFEGPSGSGKTTFMKTLENMKRLHLVTLPVEVPRPRAYETPDNGVRLSSLKDMLHLWAAVSIGAHPSMPLGIDRGFISQEIYSAIRLNKLPAEIRDTSATLRFHVRKLLNWIIEDFQDRGEPLEDTLPEIYYVFYLPPVKVIQARRDHATNREYPYSAQREYDLYSAHFSKWMNSAILIQDMDDERKFINDFLL